MHFSNNKIYSRDVYGDRRGRLALPIKFFFLIYKYHPHLENICEQIIQNIFTRYCFIKLNARVLLEVLFLNCGIRVTINMFRTVKFIIRHKIMYTF